MSRMLAYCVDVDLRRHPGRIRLQPDLLHRLLACAVAAICRSSSPGARAAQCNTERASRGRGPILERFRRRTEGGPMARKSTTRTPVARRERFRRTRSRNRRRRSGSPGWARSSARSPRARRCSTCSCSRARSLSDRAREAADHALKTVRAQADGTSRRAGRVGQARAGVRGPRLADRSSASGVLTAQGGRATSRKQVARAERQRARR